MESTWLNWLEMLMDAYWEKKSGPDRTNDDKEYWGNFPDYDRSAR
jgi:hypothetical protein